MNKKEYSRYVSRRMPRSRAARNMLRAFVSGGLICTLGQILHSLYERGGMESDAAAGAVSVTLVLLRRRRDPGADHRLCKCRGVPGAGIQDRGQNHRNRSQNVRDLRPGDRVRCEHRRGIRAYPVADGTSLKQYLVLFSRKSTEIESLILLNTQTVV